MLHKIIHKGFRNELGFAPTPAQEEAITRLTEFITSTAADEAFLLMGYAGTGKTSLVKALVTILPRMRQKYLLLAPTGRAAKVLHQYTGQAAFTIHKKIYRQKAAGDQQAGFLLQDNLHKRTLFIVDEASMIADTATDSLFGSGRLLNDLIDFVYSQPACRLLLIGDTAQLPPVGVRLSPALQMKYLKTFTPINTVHRVIMRDVIRQSADSGILFNATQLRRLMPDYQAGQFPIFDIESYPDFAYLAGADMQEVLEEHFGNNEHQAIVITRSNKRARLFNEGIRQTVLWREEEITAGDWLMVVRNNYFWLQDDSPSFIANGDMAEITNIFGFEEMYGLHFADVSLRLPDYNNLVVEAKILLDTLHSDAPSLSQDQNQQFYEAVMADYEHIGKKSDRLKALRKNEYFNALQVKFAHAVTCHKAQGGQWDTVFIDQGYLTDDQLTLDYLRWLYTAITRAQKQVYLVNFRAEFFTNGLPD